MVMVWKNVVIYRNGHDCLPVPIANLLEISAVQI